MTLGRLFSISDTTLETKNGHEVRQTLLKNDLYNAIPVTKRRKIRETEQPRTGGSVGWASGCHAGCREFDSDRTNTQGLSITEEKVLPL